MDLAGVKFVSDKKQPNFFPYRYVARPTPSKTMDYPFVRLGGSLSEDNAGMPTTTLLSQAKTFKTDMVGSFVGSKSQLRSSSDHQIWDVSLAFHKLNDMVRSKLTENDCYTHSLTTRLGSLFHETNNSLVSFVVANTASCYLKSPSSTVKSSPAPGVEPSAPAPNDHLTTHMQSTTSCPIALPKLRATQPLPDCPTQLLCKTVDAIQHPQPGCPTQLLYKNVDAIKKQCPNSRLLTVCPNSSEPAAIQRSYADVAKMAGGKRRPRSDEKRGYGGGQLGGYRRADRRTDRSNWREECAKTSEECAMKDARRDRPNLRAKCRDRVDARQFGSAEAVANIMLQSDGHQSRNITIQDPRNKTQPKHTAVQSATTCNKYQPRNTDSVSPIPVPSRNKYQHRNTDSVSSTPVPSRNKYQPRNTDSVSPTPVPSRNKYQPRNRRSNYRKSNAARPRHLDEKHPNFDRDCRHYNADVERCDNWRCRHGLPSGGEDPNLGGGPRATGMKAMVESCSLDLPFVLLLPCQALTTAVEKCVEALSGIQIQVEEKETPEVPVKCRTVSEDSEDSYVVFGVCDDGDSTEEWSGDSGSDEDEDDEMSVSPRLQDVNARWREGVERGTHKGSAGKKVSFAPPSHLATVHTMLAWDFAYRAARSGGVWETCARDRERFRQRILRCEPALSAVLAPQHRDRVLAGLTNRSIVLTVG